MAAASQVNESQKYTRITGAGTVTINNGSCNILGVFVAAIGTIEVLDAAAIVVNTFTPAAIGWQAMPFRMTTSLVITTGAGADITVSWGP